MEARDSMDTQHPTIAHPQRRLLRTYTGNVNDQSDDIIEMMYMLRAGWSTERAPRPNGELYLVLDHSECVFGHILLESFSSVRNGVCQFILTRWEEEIFHWFLIQIKTDNTLFVEEYVNPPDPQHVPSPRALA